MAKLNVNPTRMELARLQKQLKTAKRGHKLLKDKQDELMRQFILLVKKNNKMRQAMEETMTSAMRSFRLASATLNSSFIEELFILPAAQVELELDQKNIMSVEVPVMNFSYDEDLVASPIEYGYLNSNVPLDNSITRFTDVLPQLLALTEVEKTCQLMAGEIEKTRRRVNALEYMTIPELEETIYFIKMKLEENERAEVTRMIKIKNMNR